MLLQKEGYEIKTFENGEQVLIELRSHIPDIIVTDIEMPTMDGLELCIKIKEEFPLARQVQFIFMYTNISERSIKKAERLSKRPLIRKTFFPLPLVDLVNKILIEYHRTG